MKFSKMKYPIYSLALAAAIVGGSGLALASQNTAKMNKAMANQQATADHSNKSQLKIDQVADATKELVDEYRMTLKKIENTKQYNKQMQELIGSQAEEMVLVKNQIESLKVTNKAILPLMSRMVEMLDKFVELDSPFLGEERKQRIAKLKVMINRADVSSSEKFRRILEAYQVENEYGRTIEAYRDTFNDGPKEITVDYLRVGRIALVAQTLDGSDSFYWNQKSKSWASLDSDFKSSIGKGIRIARKQMAPNLIKVPVEAPEVLQ